MLATNKKTLFDYFTPEKRLSAGQICLPIIEELIASSVATVGKRHSGKTVRKETLASVWSSSVCRKCLAFWLAFSLHLPVTLWLGKQQ